MIEYADIDKVVYIGVQPKGVHWGWWVLFGGITLLLCWWCIIVCVFMVFSHYQPEHVIRVTHKNGDCETCMVDTRCLNRIKELGVDYSEI